MAQAPSERHLAELRTDLQVERTKLAVLVESLAALQRAWDVPEGSQERCDAAAFRLQSLYTGIERCFVQIVRVLNGGPPDGADWQRRLLDRMTSEQDEERSQQRKNQVGSGDRSERIRTYNYPQGRVTDHRIGLTLYRLESILQGDIQEIVQELTTHYQSQALQNAELDSLQR